MSRPGPPTYRAVMSIRDRLTTHGARTDSARTRVRVAANRKVTGGARDETARRRDLQAEAIEHALADSDGPIAEKLERLQVAAADDRARAASDQARSAKDRADAASERERLAAIVDQVADGIVAVDAELRVTYANAGFAADLGWTQTDLVGRSVLEVVDGVLDGPTVAKLLEVARSGQPWLGEAERRLANGTVGPVQIRVTPRRAADGALEGYIVVSRDVTELREAERAARENEGRYRSIVEQATEGIYRTSREGRILAANPALATILGYDSADALMNEVVDVGRQLWADADDRLRILRLLDGRGTVRGYECRLVRRDGTPIWVSQHVTVVRDPDGQAAYYDGFVENITERKTAEEALRRDIMERKRLEAERARLAAAVEQAADYVIVNDADGFIEAVNPAFERLTGHRAAEVLGRPVASVLRSGVDPPEVYAALDAAIARGDTWTGRLLERREDGGLLDADLSVSPIRDATGDLIGSVEIGRDRTHERELETEREREAQIRVALAESLAHIPASTTLEQAAQALCDELVRLPFVDVAEVEIFVNDEGVEMLAVAAPPGYPAIVGTRLPAAGAARVCERTAHGPWAGYVTDDPADGWIPGVHAAGLRALAYGPIVHGGHVAGALVLGTFDERVAHTLVEQMPGIVSFGATSSALLGERMHARHQEGDLRHALEDVLTARAFHPVFQPIVDLETRETVGYEALTRFDSGQRPDLCFADAWSVGFGSELEIATLEAAVAAGKQLPTGVWLDLNVSPRLLADPERLRTVLWEAGRPLVLEVTEHEVIEDYDFVRGAFHALGNDVRIAVDDAGVGIANFGHIIELRPDFVKLDISMVRRVNAHLGRQAMVVGMRHFSLTVGCRLIAEGVETVEEARTLTALGVEFGQGYWLGRPETVEHWRRRGQPRNRARLALPQAPDGLAEAVEVLGGDGVPGKVPWSG
jgi:PAS domain S-box-containing protein